MTKQSNPIAIRFGAVAVAVAVLGVAQQTRANAYNDAVLADNPVYYWTFDEVSGNALNQGAAGAGGGFNDIVPGSATSRIVSTSSGGGVQLGNAADGVIAAGITGMWQAGGVMTGGSFSKYAIEAWINYDGTTAAYLIENPANDPALISNFNGTQFEWFNNASGRTSDVGTGPTLPVGTWTHVVVGVDSTAATHEIYIDGVLFGTYGGVPTNAIGAFDSNQLILGGTAFGGGVQGSNSDYDEVAIYDLTNIASGSALSAAFADVADHYNVAPAAPVPAPAALPAGLALIAAASMRRRRHN